MQRIAQGALSMTSLEEENFKIQRLFFEATEFKSNIMTETKELNHTEEQLQIILDLNNIIEKSKSQLKKLMEMSGGCVTVNKEDKKVQFAEEIKEPPHQ